MVGIGPSNATLASASLTRCAQGAELMNLSHLFDIEWHTKGGMDPVVPAHDREGAFIGSGEGVVEGPELEGTLRFSLRHGRVPVRPGFVASAGLDLESLKPRLRDRSGRRDRERGRRTHPARRQGLRATARGDRSDVDPHWERECSRCERDDPQYEHGRRGAKPPHAQTRLARSSGPNRCRRTRGGRVTAPRAARQRATFPRSSPA